MLFDIEHINKRQSFAWQSIGEGIANIVATWAALIATNDYCITHL